MTDGHYFIKDIKAQEKRDKIMGEMRRGWGA